MGTYAIDMNKQNDLDSALIEADNMIMKKYMNGISQYDIKELDERFAKIDINKVFRINRIEKIVYESDENNLEKLMNVYNAVGLCGGSIINIIISDGRNNEYYIGTRAADVNGVSVCQDALTSAIKGNFPGSSLSLQKKDGVLNCIEKLFGTEEENKVVTVVSGIPGYRDEKNRDNNKFTQGIEKVIDAMNGKPFSLITISTPIDNGKVAQIIDGYENLYTQISPFSETQLSYNESDSNSVAKSITEGMTKTIGDNVSSTVSNLTGRTDGINTSKGINASLILFGGTSGSGTSTSETVQNGVSSTNSKSKSTAGSYSQGKTDTYTSTNGRSLQINIENKTVKNLLQKIDEMINRIEDSKDLGLWNTATYCIADDTQTSRVLASAVEAICRGEKTSIESIAVETWTDKKKSSLVKAYLRKIAHPIVKVNKINKVFEVNTASLVNGKELVIEAGLPQKSVPGIPVSKMVAFSRNVVGENTTDGIKLKLGEVYHMGCKEKNPVELDIESLSAHTLITGTTGSGKSNTVYHMLDKLKRNNIKFMVIEPAKGEYKNIFGNNSDVTVYSTNEKYAKLLQLNPFMFPESVHVLEHVDRLVDIFNVCWPMYAAMPAVLKDAVLCAYESCGWNLEDSENIYGNRVFPGFKDLLRELNNVIDKSAYSDEVKGNYIGSLITRVKSLTNGINGKLFNSTIMDYSAFFDENTIIDLSRVGSAESKSLIMGLIVMVLNEYRMDQASSTMNSKLKHITVLEEAHHLLRNSAMKVNSEEGGNLAGKSIEMLSNSIAEMRTYGEGFIIVDQSPNSLDISAIRNTNTKIIMRLPEENDRRQAGKSIALKDEQIDELARLYRGVAVVYQNNWLNSVACVIEKADVTEIPYSYDQILSKAKEIENNENLFNFLMKNRVTEKLDFDVSKIDMAIEKLNISTLTRQKLSEIIREYKDGVEPQILKEENFKNLSGLVAEIFDADEKIDIIKKESIDCSSLQNRLDIIIRSKCSELSKETVLALSQCIIRNLVEKDSRNVELYAKWREFAVEQRKLV